MITTAFFYLVYLTLVTATAPLRLFNDAQAPQGIIDVISTVSGYISAFVTSGIVSSTLVNTLIAVLTFYILFETGYLLYKVIYWIIKKIPTIS